MLPLVVSSAALHTPPPVRVYDHVFAGASLSHLRDATDQRAHSFTSVYDRSRPCRTIIESAINSLLDELGDESRYCELWYRSVFKPIDAHRDVDEVLCRRIRIGPYGVQRCPNWAHVLYLDVEENLRAPTCLFEERPRDEGVAPTDGAPRPLRTMHTVAAVDNRLLRFPGDWLHAVPQPALQYLGEEAAQAVDAEGEYGRRRAVLLFNTWDEPPLLPSADDEARLREKQPRTPRPAEPAATPRHACVLARACLAHKRARRTPRRSRRRKRWPLSRRSGTRRAARRASSGSRPQ